MIAAGIDRKEVPILITTLVLPEDDQVPIRGRPGLETRALRTAGDLDRLATRKRSDPDLRHTGFREAERDPLAVRRQRRPALTFDLEIWRDVHRRRQRGER